MRRRRLWPRLLAGALCLIGAALVVLGALLATTWKPPTTSTATVTAVAGVPLVVTAPGALSLDGPVVHVEALAASTGEPVFIGVGRTGDVDSYVGESARQVFTGIAVDGKTVVEQEGTTAQAADPSRSDIWVASVIGKGGAQLTWPEQDGSWSLVAATDGTAAPQEVSLTWRLPASSSYAPTLIALGALMIVVGVVALAMVVVRSHEQVAS